MSQRPFVIGANYQTCPSGLRDKLFLDQDERSAFRQHLTQQGLRQCQIISTCDRVEIFGFHHQAEEACRTIQGKLMDHATTTRRQADDIFFRRYDDDAILHIFNVCTALDSQMIGEAQILGQIKEAWTESQKGHSMGPELDRLMQTAFNLAKRVRSQTKIGEGAVSVAAAGVKLARDLHGALDDSRGMIYGLGEAGQIMLDQFKAAGMHHWMLSGAARRTERYAKRLHCHFVPEQALQKKLLHCDILITASGLGRFLLDDGAFKTLMQKRRFKPLLIIDCGVPLDIDPGVDRLDSLFRYSIEDLERLAERGQTNREKEADQARSMVQEAVIEYRRSLAEQDGIPALVELREHFDKTRQLLLRQYPHLDATEATRLLINKLLHNPSEALRAMAADGSDADLKDWITVNRVLQQLFSLRNETGSKEKTET